MSTTPNDRAAWGSIPTLRIQRAHCLHCGSLNLDVYGGRERSTGARLQYARCLDCQGKIKIVQEVVSHVE